MLWCKKSIFLAIKKGISSNLWIEKKLIKRRKDRNKLHFFILLRAFKECKLSASVTTYNYNVCIQIYIYAYTILYIYIYYIYMICATYMWHFCGFNATICSCILIKCNKVISYWKTNECGCSILCTLL